MAARPTKSTASAPAAQAAAPKPAALDFSKVSVETVEEMPKRESNSKVKSTPVYEWMQDSLKNGTGKAVTIPEAQVQPMTNLIRQAANLLGCGAKIVPGKVENGNVRLAFTAKTRRAYKPRTKK